MPQIVKTGLPVHFALPIAHNYALVCLAITWLLAAPATTFQPVRCLGSAFCSPYFCSRCVRRLSDPIWRVLKRKLHNIHNAFYAKKWTICHFSDCTNQWLCLFCSFDSFSFKFTLRWTDLSIAVSGKIFATIAGSDH